MQRAREMVYILKRKLFVFPLSYEAEEVQICVVVNTSESQPIETRELEVGQCNAMRKMAYIHCEFDQVW